MAWIQAGATIIFKPYSLEQALEGVAEAGFENVEIGAVKGFLERLDPDDLGLNSVRRTQALLDRHGLRCVSLSGHAPLHVEDGVRRLRNVLQAGKELRVLVVNTYTDDAETPEQRAAFVEQIRAISDEAEEAGIRLCLETDSNMLPTAAIGAKLLDEIGHPWLQMNYDPGNVVYFAGERPQEDVRHAIRLARTRPPEGQTRGQGRPRPPGVRRGRARHPVDPPGHQGVRLLRPGEHGDRVRKLRVAGLAGLPRRRAEGQGLLGRVGP